MEYIREQDLLLKRVEGHRMYLDKLDTGISSSLKRFKWLRKWYREPAFMDIIDREVSKGFVAFDLGANIGYATLLMAKRVGREGRVYAVEPSPKNIAILKRNIGVNSYTERVKIYPLAISSFNGEAQFNLSEASNLHSLVQNEHARDVITVKTVTMDEFFKDKPLPNFIKMDIEGAEVEAFEGMNEILVKKQAVMKILVEVHQKYYSPTRDFRKQLERLFNAGFVPRYVISTGSKDQPFFRERGYTPLTVYHSGEWTRGVYLNVKQEDVLESMKPDQIEEFSLPLRCLFRRPARLSNRVVRTFRIVRALMLERA